jgi:acyl-CoA dehydrogenase
MMFQTAKALLRADGGDKEYYSLVRILTPLIKFRACRDARKVTGDAMEARGGCGYIEEWSDARLVRDAHLGSIWEGTSNIVALDVLRAIRRDGSLDALRNHLHHMLNESSFAVDTELRADLESALDRSCTLAMKAADPQGDALARRAASALYHVTSAVSMAWEATQLHSPKRTHLARMVLQHRVLKIDPLAFDDVQSEEIIDLLLS